ncbi:peptide ABC transporter substrate-binding protein [Allostreptomyces psammosilenae]|uniref:ABC-type transport system substrate-binding protein n=1 Tax=Allostreptomyces psammosilenae TaxID=1892865 RepID=A0A853ABV7_9ACTN|nr:ABC transporter substrate-binding protein [Allostreptomyces psammosilenae]NYI08071.1 ABC-type transport system substrate-binding protein [Allostreptomyces psammosilenae]
MRGAKRAKWVVGAVAVALAATACGGGSGDGGGGEEPVSIGISEPKHLIPSTTTETEGSQVLSALFTPLVEFDENNEPFEVAAESIEPNEDNTVWTVKLKPGMKFHDGTDVTSDSYINAWNYGAYGPNAHDGNYFFNFIQGYDALNPADPDGEGEQTAPEPTTDKLSGLVRVDDTTFEIHLNAPFSGFKSVLGYTAFYPLPDAAFEDIEAYEQAPIGNGPFKMVGEWQHDQLIQVEAFEDYTYTDKPLVDKIDFKIYQSEDTQYNDLIAGELDVVKKIPTTQLAAAESELGDRLQMFEASAYQMLAFPTYQEEYSNVEVRRAISMAIDRDAISETIFQGSEVPARSFVSPVVAGYRENTCGEWCEFDPERAREMYEAAGGPDTINIGYNADGGHKEWVDATCNQLNTNLGVQCNGTPVAKFAELLTQVEEKSFSGMFRMGWVMDYPSMENYLGPLYSTNGSSNYYGYSNPEFDQLVEEGRQAPTEEEAIAKWQQAEDILAQDLPAIPLRTVTNPTGFSENVTGVHLDLFDRVDVLTIDRA